MIKFSVWGKDYEINSPKGVVIVDLDGTLADGKHRLHLLPTKDLHLTESWSEFNRAAVDDRPIESTIMVVNGLWVSGFGVVVLTGRSDEVQRETAVWLDFYGVKYDCLIMRRHDDNRKDTIIKEDVLRAIGLDRIVCAFDDSPTVIPFMRSLGITTYAVTEYAKPRSDLQGHSVESLNNG